MSTPTPRFSQPDANVSTCPHCADVHERGEYAERRIGGQLRFDCPTCGRQFRPSDRLSTFFELFEALSQHRRGTHIDRMAAALLRYEQGTRELVGLTEDASRALFLNTESRTLVAARFDKHGVCELVDETLVRGIRDAESWLEGRRPTVLWTHPRYR